MWRAVRTTLCRACSCQRCCFQTRRWCSQSGCSPQCRCRRIWGCWGSFQTSSAFSGRRALMCLLQHCICVSRPCEILGDVNTEELKAVYPLHRCLVDGDGCVFSALSPVIHHQLLGLVDVEWEVVLLAPFSQGLSSLSVIRPITVVSSANLTMTLELCVAVQSCVYREYRSGLRTQPCGAPVLRVRGDEVLLPILTTWLLPVRKSRIQLHRDLFSPRVWSFSTSVEGTMVLNDKL